MDIQELPLGIPEKFEFGYLLPREGKSNFEELVNITYFIIDFFKNGGFVNNPDYQYKFLNWGYTGVVYALRVNDNLFAMTINQPTVPPENMKKDYQNLLHFGKKLPNSIVSPISFYENKDMGFATIISPYIYQARCLSNEYGSWGAFVPEPDYRYVPYTPEQQKELLPCIIAKLVQLYDSKENLGIASCKTIDGDFILEKKLDEEEFTTENIMKRMKLITIRDTINIPLDDYINLLRKEFSTATQEGYLINSRAKLSIPHNEIEKGIELGLHLRELDRSRDED